MKNESTAYYLKYRPQTLDDLVGQAAVKKILSQAFLNQKLAHAYLLVGPRGTGKTSTARILAKMVNCEDTSHIPCNKCSTCLSITDGSNLDLIEIDAASNRGIDDIRSLREKIKLAPSGSKKKVYIIDEVHMLTTEAFNALLKTLEEPPAHALFILATTDVGKVPQTIISRVQRLDFKLASSKEIVAALEKIIKEEKIDIEEEALKLLAKEADGSFRDGVKLLDQVASLGDNITAATLLATLKSSNFDDQIDLLEKLADKKGAEGLVKINKQIEGGADVGELIMSLQDLMRSLMLIKNGVGEQLVKIEWSEERYEKLVELSEKFNEKDLIKGLDFLQEAFEKLKFASIPQLPLEIAVVEICTSQTVIARSEATWQSDSNKTIDDKQSLRDESLKQSLRSGDLGELKIEVENGSLKVEKQEEIHPQSSIIENPPSTLDHPSSNSDSSDILKLKEKWTFVLETIRPYNFSLEALLRSVNITECTDTIIIMEVPYSFHQRILEAPKNKDLLESILSDILGRSIKVTTVLGNRPQRKEDIANIGVAADDEIIRAAAEIFNSDTIN